MQAEVHFNDEHTAVFLRVNGRTVLCIDSDGKLHIPQNPEKDWTGNYKKFHKADLRLSELVMKG